MDGRTQRAYRVASAVARQKIGEEDPLDAEALDALEASDIVVVTGAYDHVETVLEALAMPFTRVAPAQLASVPLRPEQLVVVNCPGEVGPRQVARLAGFVDAGGSLFTTDWALRHVIEPAFPNTISYNGHPTADDVVRVEIRDHDNPFLRGVMEEGDDPQWWLEGSSYPIRIHDPARVQVLMSSSELAARYGESPVAVVFGSGRGEVFHMISHYYLQRTELRSARHQMAASEFVAAKGAALRPDVAAQADGLSLGEVEAAHSSARLFANVVARQKRRAGKGE